MTTRSVQAENTSKLVQAISRLLTGKSEVEKDISPLGILKLTIHHPAQAKALYSADPVVSASVENDEDGFTGFSTDVVGNRTPIPSNIAKLKTAMLEGRWDEDNGETLKFSTDEDSNPMLIDGQNRLRAAEAALAESEKLRRKGLTFTVMLVPNARSILTIDVGASRNVANFLTICAANVPKEDRKFLNDVGSAGRDLWRARLNRDGHPCRKPDVAATEGDIARWIMEDIDANTGEPFGHGLMRLRKQFDSELRAIAGKRGSLLSAGAKSWLLYLAYEWTTTGDNPETTAQIMRFLASGQDSDLPAGRRNGIWQEARTFATECQIRAGGFKAANKEAHDNVLLGYTLAWLYFTGQIQRKRGSFAEWVAEHYPIECDKNGRTRLAPDGRTVLRGKTAVWPKAE